MTGTGAESLAEMLDERQHLLEIALWMFGSPAAADRVVQETYRRWYALDDGERTGIAVPRAWLTRVAGGLCLELLATTATAFGAPEPALLTAGRALPPATAGLAPWPVTAGRALPPATADLALPPVTEGPAFPPEPPRPLPVQAASRLAMLDRHDRVVHRFAVACGSGGVEAVRLLLAEDAMVVSDGGGKLRAPVRPTHGADAVARFVTALLAGRPGTEVAVGSVNGRSGMVLRRSGQAVAVVSVSVAGMAVTAVWIVLNPDKLQRWHRSWATPEAAGVPRRDSA